MEVFGTPFVCTNGSNGEPPLLVMPDKVVSESITPELIQMKEAEARLKHGWVTVKGADTVVTQQGN